LDAGRSVELALVRKLDTDLADVVGPLVVRGVAPFFDARDVAVVDSPDVADRVRGHFPVRILAEEARLDLDARETGAVHREARELVVGQPGAQREALEVLRLFEQLPEALAVARLDIDDLGERIDRLLEILHARGLDFQRVARVALREHDAVAIANDAAVR